ncbi:hypothetical protein ACIRPX_35370 [Streptomyces sp. NPDC101225]|uniref:hypothetical protein n=1 Tax=Streptomyces sp. NPDC101225 TaxID=3366135 RepID=UPI0037F9E9F4
MASGLIADWALWGKVPRTTRGYEVLAAHPPDRSGEFNAAIQHWTPGTPSPGDRLPWITIGCAPDSEGTGTVGVFLLDGSEDFDISNRLIHRISHFAVPYPHVRDTGIGWCALARAAVTTAESLSETRTGPAELIFDDEDLLVNDIAGHITPSVSATTRWLAAAAAYLLDGPVALTGNSGYEPFGVLRTLDSVAALLPFGVRGTLSAATSISPGAQVPMRLFWGDPLGAPGVTGLPLSGELPDLGGLSSQARTYHDLLLKNWTKQGGTAVVRHLADAREPLDIADPGTPGYALDVLARLDRALAAVQDIDEGRTLGHEQIALAVRTPQIGSAELAVLAPLALQGPEESLAAVAPHLSEDGTSQAFREQLRGDLLDGRTEAALSSFENMRAARVRAGLDLDPLDQILAGVMDEALATCAPHEPEPVTQSLLPGVVPFAAGSMDLTQSMLRQRAGLASRLVRALYDMSEPAARVHAWLRWLCGEPDPRRPVEIAGSAELPVLYSMLSTGTGLAGAARKWTAGQPGAPALLLEGAVACGHGNEVLQHPGFLDTLIGSLFTAAVAPDDADPGALLQEALARRPDGLRPETAALWDVLCALTGLPPSGFTTVVATPPLPGTSGSEHRVTTYATALRAALEGKLLRRHAGGIVRDLLAGVLAVDPATGQGPGPAGRNLTLYVLDWSDPYPQSVLAAVHRLAAETPHWDETDRDTEWLTRLTGRLPALRSALALREVLRFAKQSSGTPEDCGTLAAHACAARRAEADKDQLCAALMAWAVRGQRQIGERILAVFNAYQTEWALYAGAERAVEERADLENAIARVDTDRPLLTYYCDHATRLLARQDTEAADEIRQLQDRRSLWKVEMDRLRKLKASGHTRT